MEPALDLAQVLGVHPCDPVRNFVERLAAGLPRCADGGAELPRNRMQRPLWATAFYAGGGLDEAAAAANVYLARLTRSG